MYVEPLAYVDLEPMTDEKATTHEAVKDKIISMDELHTFIKENHIDEAFVVDETINIAVQVNGKTRSIISIPNNCVAAVALEIARADEKVAAFLEGKTVVKEIFVPNKILNIVVR